MQEYIINQEQLNFVANAIAQAYPNVIKSIEILNKLPKKDPIEEGVSES